jgi:DNA mismatch repair protein MutL
MRIKILPDEVASQIAAGEVVERASSVVKELLENAIDAGATRIGIRIAEELTLAVTRHATSKLSVAEDLFHITTLGFRGEALASIGSVSQMNMTSRSVNESTGSRITIEGGKVISFESAGVPSGTVVRVMNLFFNTPARLKFLKRDQTERQQIENLVTRYALAYPNLAIQLEMDGKQVLHTSGKGDCREILAQLYGYEQAKQLLEVIFEEGDVKIHGYISPISMTRSNRKEITFFVNGRWIQDLSLSTALVRAYQTYLMVGRYPISILFIDLNPEEVDVNVHPAKSEVRFRQPDSLFSFIQRAVKRALLAYSPIPQLNLNRWQTPQTTSQLDPAWINARLNWEKDQQKSETPSPIDQVVSPSLVSGVETGRIPLLRLIGQIGSTYLVAEGPDGLYLIDQHAAHERVLYEKMIAQVGSAQSQTMLQPEIITMPPQSARIMAESLDILNRIGFSVNEFGTNTFRVSAIPALFGNGDPQAALRSVVEDFEEDETPLQNMIENRLIARVCKRMAVKGGQSLSADEQFSLVRDLEKCASPRTCPHGRPTMIHLSVDLLDRQFGRRGARSS